MGRGIKSCVAIDYYLFVIATDGSYWRGLWNGMEWQWMSVPDLPQD